MAQNEFVKYYEVLMQELGKHTGSSLERLALLCKNNDIKNIVRDEAGLSEDELLKAFKFLILASFKADEVSLSALVPESISGLISYLLHVIFEEKKVKVFDPFLQSGYFINSVAFEKTECFGLEMNENFRAIIKTLFSLSGKGISIFSEEKEVLADKNLFDCLITVFEDDFLNDEYYPYQVINKYLGKIKDEGWFLFLASDYFLKDESFMSFLENESIKLAFLFSLPTELFKNNRKHLIAIQKTKKTSGRLAILDIESFNDKKHYQEILLEFQKIYHNMKGN
ncbi:MAG: hypothetical protein FWE36_00615 [Erysipelotrichales bacterium]|nr:hypothetical protein [Erysipelotrichales bacterium]